VWALRRRGRRVAIPAPALATVELRAPAEPDPFATAAERLREIEAAGWESRGEVARHYEAVADVLREYLEAAESLPARERTTAELLPTLPPHLAENGLRDACEAVLAEADLVKFARRRPGRAAAAEFLAHARALLARWRDVARVPEAADAIR
jgi:hypothetical protein